MDTALDDAEQRCVIAQFIVRVAAALGPAQAELHRGARDRLGGRVRGALVEDHHHVRIQHLLDAHALFRTQEHTGPVGRRGEGHALLGDLAAVGQREHLETAGVGQNRAIPAREAVQAAVVGDHVQARAQVQMEGIAEDDLRTQRADLLRQDALHRAIGAHRHEGRGFHGPAREGQAAAAGATVGGLELELESGHGAVIRADSLPLSPKTAAPAPPPVIPPAGTAASHRHS